MSSGGRTGTGRTTWSAALGGVTLWRPGRPCWAPCGSTRPPSSDVGINTGAAGTFAAAILLLIDPWRGEVDQAAHHLADRPVGRIVISSVAALWLLSWSAPPVGWSERRHLPAQPWWTDHGPVGWSDWVRGTTWAGQCPGRRTGLEKWGTTGRRTGLGNGDDARRWGAGRRTGLGMGTKWGRRTGLGNGARRMGAEVDELG